VVDRCPKTTPDPVIRDADEIAAVAVVQPFARVLIRPETTTGEDPVVGHRLVGLLVSNPVLGAGLVPLAILIDPQDEDVDDGPRRRRILRGELDRLPRRRAYGKQCRVDVLSFAVHRHNRLVLLRPARTGEHFQQSLTQADHAIDQDQLALGIDPDGVVFGQTNQIRARFLDGIDRRSLWTVGLAVLSGPARSLPMRGN
jgi:hypothetical protein